MSDPRVTGEGAAVAGVMLAALVFMLIAVAGEGLQRRAAKAVRCTEIGAQCPAEGEWTSPVVPE